MGAAAGTSKLVLKTGGLLTNERIPGVFIRISSKW
jgi:hypothetical protein